jgi:hypothetical protein
MIITLFSIIVSLIYIVASLIIGSPYTAMIPVFFWSVALSNAELFLLTAPISVPLFFLSIPALIWVTSKWVGLVASASKDEKMKKDYDKFIKKFYPLELLKVFTPLYDALVYVFEQAKNTLSNYIDLYKMIWNKGIAILTLIVTLGGAVDESLAPPLPGKLITKEMLESGRFWMKEGVDEIYFSEDITKIPEQFVVSFKNEKEYNKFRETYRLKTDEKLSEVLLF